MFRHGWAPIISFWILALWSMEARSQSQQVVYRSVSSAKLDAILKELDISFQKTPGKKDGIFSYDFERHGAKVRLYNYGGDDLWIESYFTEKTNLVDVNRWNMRAKFSRAVLVKEGETISLEAQIDCTLGVTDGMIRQFVQRFDNEVQAFVRFLKNTK
jgi:putative sensory transduction regulator